MESVGKCPTIARGGGGGWALLELTDALVCVHGAFDFSEDDFANPRWDWLKGLNQANYLQII